MTVEQSQQSDERVARRRFDWTWWGWMGAIALVSLGIRIGAVVGRPNRTAGGDAYYYHTAANMLVDGLGWIDPFLYYPHHLHEHVQMAEWPPLFVVMLAASSLVGFKTYFAHRIWSGVLGTVAVVVCGMAGREVAGRRVGLFAAFVCAIYPNIWMSDEPALSETITPLLIGLVLYTAYRFWKRPTLWRAVWTSVAIAIAALGRDELTLLFLVLLLPLILLARSVSFPRRIGLLAAAVVAAAVVLGPWVGYNLSRFEKPVFITDGFGVTLASANCPLTWFVNNPGYWSYACALEVPLNPHVDQSVQEAEAEHYTMHFILTHKNAWVRVGLEKVGRGFGFFQPADQIHLDSTIEGRPYHWAMVGLFSYYGLFGLSLVGAVIVFRRKVTLLPLVAVTLNVIFAMIITFGNTRYRTPFEVVLAILASVTVDAALAALGRRRRRRRAVPQSPASDEDREPGPVPVPA